MKLFAKKILLADGWASDKTLTIENGVITDIFAGYIEGAEQANGVVIPGMVNCHSHAFQRAFAGFSEQGSEGQDSFWTWRNIMYKFLGQLSAQDAQIIAQQLYIEMLKMGYTRVAEFHYLHHDIDGENYAELSAMAQAIFAAAQQSGIGLTLLPVLYRFSGFGAQAPSDGQKRFINSTEQFNNLVSECFALAKLQPNSNVGIAPHSLRATSCPEEYRVTYQRHAAPIGDRATWTEGNTMRILIADDHELLRDTLMLYIGNEPGMTAESVEDLNAAEARIAAGEADDLVLPDFTMPGMDGLGWAP